MLQRLTQDVQHVSPRHVGGPYLDVSVLCLSLMIIFISLGEDFDYNGDDDQFDTLERQRRTIALPDELPSVIHEGMYLIITFLK